MMRRVDFGFAMTVSVIRFFLAMSCSMSITVGTFGAV